MELLLILGVLLAVSLVPGIRRFVMGICVFGALGVWALASATDAADEHRNLFFGLFAVIFVLLLIVGLIQTAVIRHRESAAIEESVARGMARSQSY